MRNIVLSSVMLAVLAGGALAQTASTPPADVLTVSGSAVKAPPPPPPAGPGAMDDAGPGAPPPPDGPRGRRPPPPPPSKAAHFRLERGDLALDVKCAEDEPMKACAEIAVQLLDKAQSIPKP